jgi:hypothetical protein
METLKYPQGSLNLFGAIHYMQVSNSQHVGVIISPDSLHNMLNE